MIKFNIVVADPPWSFSDKLSMSSIKRGADAQYSTLTIEQLKSLPISNIIEDDAVLALWTVGSQLQEALDVMEAWKFRQTQVFVWVKTKQVPFEKLKYSMNKLWKDLKETHNALPVIDEIVDSLVTIVQEFNLSDILSFKMGRIFRQTHEICLIGVRGKIYKKLLNKSQRSVCFDISKKHSSKTEFLQDKLEIMFGKDAKYLEIFARRQREGWTCVGLECPSSIGEPIDISIERLKNL